jgi:hypothetical protein
MQKEKLEISDELLQNLSIDEIAELKVEVDDLLSKIDNILNTCNVALNS